MGQQPLTQAADIRTSGWNLQLESSHGSAESGALPEAGLLVT